MQTRRRMLLMIEKGASTRNLQEREERRGGDTHHLSLKAPQTLRRIPQNLIVSQIRIRLRTLAPRAMKGGRREREVRRKISTGGPSEEISAMRRSGGYVIRDRNANQEGLHVLYTY